MQVLLGARSCSRAIFAETQLRMIIDGAHLILSHGPFVERRTPLIGAGVGRFVVKRLAQRLGFAYVDFSDLIEADAGGLVTRPAIAPRPAPWRCWRRKESRI